MGSLQALFEKESFNPYPNWELALPPILLTETHKSPLNDTALLCPLICVCFQPAETFLYLCRVMSSISHLVGSLCFVIKVPDKVRTASKHSALL